MNAARPARLRATSLHLLTFAFAVADLGGSFHLGRSLEVFARVLNLFDREYEEAFGYPSPGRTAFAGVRVARGR